MLLSKLHRKSKTNDIPWPFLVRLISRGKCTPLIGNKISMEFIFGQYDMVQAWAKDIQYPMADRTNLPRIAQFLSIISGDEFLAKTEYLEFLKQSLLQQARNGLIDSVDFLDMLEEELPVLTFSEVASRLRYSDFEKNPEHPLFILAQLPLRVYITTSYHTLLEEALKDAGKKPQSDFYRWSDELEKDEFFEESPPPGFRPSVEEPLVYHLHGIDSEPTSLVLTEEDYFEFFEHISQDLVKSEGIPNTVRRALATSALLLLGYEFDGWPFRVLFRGPIKAIFNRRRPRSLSIQFSPPDQGLMNTKAVRQYLEQYFGDYKFNIYWGNVESFTQELWSHWER